jgi:hypothetical protein
VAAAKAPEEAAAAEAKAAAAKAADAKVAEDSTSIQITELNYFSTVLPPEFQKAVQKILSAPPPMKSQRFTTSIKCTRCEADFEPKFLLACPNKHNFCVCCMFDMMIEHCEIDFPVSEPKTCTTFCYQCEDTVTFSSIVSEQERMTADDVFNACLNHCERRNCWLRAIQQLFQALGRSPLCHNRFNLAYLSPRDIKEEHRPKCQNSMSPFLGRPQGASVEMINEQLQELNSISFHKDAIVEEGTSPFHNFGLIWLEDHIAFFRFRTGNMFEDGKINTNNIRVYENYNEISDYDRWMQSLQNTNINEYPKFTLFKRSPK